MIDESRVRALLEMARSIGGDWYEYCDQLTRATEAD